MTPGDPTLASDAERDSAVRILQTAHADGRLDEVELAERIEAALLARTHGNLAVLTIDLPGDAAQTGAPHHKHVPVPQPAQPPARRRYTEATQAWTAWAAVNGITFTVWLIIAVTAGAWYPWFLWVAGPWGAVLAVKTITAQFSNDA